MFRQIESHPVAMLGLAELALDEGRVQDAEELVQRYLRHIPEANRLQRAPGLELLVRIASLSGKRVAASEALATLKFVSEAVATAPLRGAAAFSAAAFDAAEGRWDSARTHLEDAVDLFEASGTPYEAARARLELAGALVALGRSDRAEREALAAREALDGLGSVFHARRAAALARDIAARTGDSSSGDPPGELTVRQRDILRLVSRGKNDREIAVELGLSEHTVHRHVANILMRLDTPTRAAAVAHAASHGLI
jgi:DNA-binding CsgD family transcriptional regulator